SRLQFGTVSDSDRSKGPKGSALELKRYPIKLSRLGVAGPKVERIHFSLAGARAIERLRFEHFLQLLANFLGSGLLLGGTILLLFRVLNARHLGWQLLTFVRTWT